MSEATASESLAARSSPPLLHDLSLGELRMSRLQSRRQFLAAASAASFASVALLHSPSRVLGAVRKFEDDPFLGWPIGAQSYSLRNFELDQAARHLQGLGLHYVELFSKHMPLEAEGESLAAIKQVLADAGIELRAHGVSGFNGDHDANRKVFEFAKRAGIKTITANPEPNSFESLDKLCEEYQVRIAIHNHGPGALYDSIDSVVDAVKDRHPLFGACVDTGHFIRSKEDPVEAVRRLEGRVFALHVKDEEKQEANSHNVIIGTGHLDLVGLFTALKETNFPHDGALSLEYEANPDNPVEEMRACLEAAKAALSQVGAFG